MAIACAGFARRAFASLLSRRRNADAKQDDGWEEPRWQGRQGRQGASDAMIGCTRERPAPPYGTASAKSALMAFLSATSIERQLSARNTAWSLNGLDILRAECGTQTSTVWRSMVSIEFGHVMHLARGQRNDDATELLPTPRNLYVHLAHHETHDDQMGHQTGRLRSWHESSTISEGNDGLPTLFWKTLSWQAETALLLGRTPTEVVEDQKTDVGDSKAFI